MRVWQNIRTGLLSGSRFKRGMTLIELLISLSIIAMMTGVAIPAFSYYQRRSAVDNDAQALVQMFNYARALQNNPDNFSRNGMDDAWKYELRLTNYGSNRQMILYSTADLDSNNQPTVIIDQLTLSEDIQVGYQIGSPNKGNGLTITFSGKPPAEIVTCSTPCDKNIEIKLSSPAPYSTTRIVVISNSLLNPNGSLKRPFSVTLK